MNLNETFKAVRAASRKLAMMDAQTINTVLCAVADKIEEKTDVFAESQSGRLAANGNVQSGNTTA